MPDIHAFISRVTELWDAKLIEGKHLRGALVSIDLAIKGQDDAPLNTWSEDCDPEWGQS